MKKILQIALWIISGILVYLIFLSVNGPIEFKKVRKERFQAVIDNLKDIRDAQEAFKTVNGKYTSDFNALVTFVDTASFTITQQRDSSFMRFDKNYKIDLQVDTIVIDTLGFEKVRERLFKDSDRYKTMMKVPFAPEGTQFEMKADVIDSKGYKSPVFEVKVKKDLILGDQPKDLMAQENTRNSVEEVNGAYISVGSLEKVSNNGNWPPIYDRKEDN